MNAATTSLRSRPHRDDGADATAAGPAEPEPRRSATLLLVEDSDLDAHLVERLLRRIDIDVEVVRARDGEEALRLITDDAAGTRVLPRPLAMLIDINMPRMGGLELLDELEASGRTTPGAPIFLVSATEQMVGQEAVQAHRCVRGTLVRPVNRQVLERVLSAAIDG